MGGKINTAAKNIARMALTFPLRDCALYVKIASANDLATLLSSGFQANSTNRAQSVLGQVQIKDVQIAQSGALKVRISPPANAKSFEGRIKAANGSEFGPSISFASSRAIIFKGSTARMNYTLQSGTFSPARKVAQASCLWGQRASGPVKAKALQGQRGKHRGKMPAVPTGGRLCYCAFSRPAPHQSA